MSALNRLLVRQTPQAHLQENSPTPVAIEPVLPFGLKILVDGNDPDIDVVAIHGLDGHRENSWTAKNGTLWLKDLLPTKLPNARIITYGYDANTHGQQQLTPQYLHDHATTLINNLILFRDETSTEERPVIFVAHSLGGILLKSALIQLHLGDISPDRAALVSSIYGILFFGTPHRGSAAAESGAFALNVRSIFTPTCEALIRYLRRDSEINQQQLLQFALISQSFDINFFYELYPTEVAHGITIMLVPKKSAVPDAANDTVGSGLYKDHVHMVKFTSANDPDFWNVSRHLLRMARRAIAARTPDMEHRPTSAAEHPRPGLRDSDQPQLLEPPVTVESTTPNATREWGHVEPTMPLISEGNVQEFIHGSSTATSDNHTPETAREETNIRAGIYSLRTGRGLFPLTSAVCHYQIVDVQVGASLVQNYVSDAATIHEVSYVFPLPHNAAVCSFKAVIDERRTITGVIKEKVRAKQYYKQAVATGRTAALLEKHHADIFQVSLGNIEPRQTISIHISFVAVIAHDSAPGSLRLMIPVTIAPRYGSTSPIPPPNSGSTTVSNSRLQVTLSVQMAGPITSITSPTHRIALNFGTASVAHADPRDPTRAHLSLESETLLDKDIVIVVTSQNLDLPRCTVETHGVTGTDAYALTLVPHFNLPPLQRQEYIFLVDRSGSMAGQRIQGVRTALQIMLRSLPTQNTSFNIWSFGSSFSSLWPTSRAYSASSIQEATTRINSFGADYGGTEIGRALQAVFNCASPQRDWTLPKAIILLTDGEVWDVQGVISLVSQAVEHATAENSLLRTFVLGIGDNSSTPMCEGIARAGKGIAVFVGNNENLEGKLMGLLKAARGSAIDDLAVDWGFDDDFGLDQDEDFVEPGPSVPTVSINPFGRASNLTQNQISLGPGGVVVRLPPPPRIQQAPLTEKLLIPLYPGFRCSIFAIIKRDMSGPVPSTVRLTGHVLGQPILVEVPVTRSTTFPLRDLGDNLEVLHVLAAHSLIQALEDLPKSDENDAKIIRLATQYSLASCYTSFIAIDEEEGAITPLTPVPSEVPTLPTINSYSNYPMSPSLFPPSTSSFSPNLGSTSASSPGPNLGSLSASSPGPNLGSLSASSPGSNLDSLSPSSPGPNLGSLSPSSPGPNLGSPSPSSPGPDLGSLSASSPGPNLGSLLASSPGPDLGSLSAPSPGPNLGSLSASSPGPNLGSLSTSSLSHNFSSSQPSTTLNTPLLPPSASSLGTNLGSSRPSATPLFPRSSLSRQYIQPSTALQTPRYFPSTPSFSNSSQPSTTLKAPRSLSSSTYVSQVPTTVGTEAGILPVSNGDPGSDLGYSYYDPVLPARSPPSAPSSSPNLSFSQPSTILGTSRSSFSTHFPRHSVAVGTRAPVSSEGITALSEDIADLSDSDYKVSPAPPPLPVSFFTPSFDSSQPSTILNTTGILPFSKKKKKFWFAPQPSNSWSNRATSSSEGGVSGFLHAPSEYSVKSPSHYLSDTPASAKVVVKVGETAMPTTEGFAHNQAFEGCFKPTSLRGVFSELPEMPLSLDSLSVGQADKDAIWMTLLVIAYMNRYLGAEQAAWELMAEKGMDYVRRVLGGKEKKVNDVDTLLRVWNSKAREAVEGRRWGPGRPRQ